MSALADELGFSELWISEDCFYTGGISGAAIALGATSSIRVGLGLVSAVVRHPAVLGPLIRSRPLAVHELLFAQTLTRKPIKVALPGPYLLTRTMWLECVSDQFYASREQLAQDIVRVLREEVQCLLAAGAALVASGPGEMAWTRMPFGPSSAAM